MLNRLLALFLMTSLFGAAAPAFAQELTSRQLMRDDIDVYAQRSLRRMSQRAGPEAEAARTIYEAVRSEQLAGLYIINQGVPALRAKAQGIGWWTVIPTGSDAVCMQGGPGEAPLIAYRTSILQQSARLDAAILAAFEQCGLGGSTRPNAVAWNEPDGPFDLLGDVRTVQLAGGSGSVKLRAPHPVKQHSRFYCWAASLQSWLGMFSDRTNQSQHALVRQYGQKDDPATYGHLDLASPEYRRMLTDLRLEASNTVACSTLSDDTLQEVLRKKGHFMLLHRNHGREATSHVIVVYGVVANPSLGPLVCTMDPGTGLSQCTTRLSDLQGYRSCKLYVAR